MKKEYLEQLSLCELFDLLSEQTLELLDSLQKRSDVEDLAVIKSRVELLQDIIRQKKINSGN
jgi:hypothetical protein